MPRIDVHLLEVGKDQLTWSCVVAVRTQQHVGQPELGRHLQEVLGLVILGSVDDDDGVLPPVSSLLVQSLRQGPEEELHHLAVRVGLGEGDIHIAQGVKTQDHGDSWLHLELGIGVGGPWYLPLHPPKVGHP